MTQQMQEVLDFWFPDDEGHKWWFVSTKETDEEISRRFTTVYNDAVAGKLTDWRDTPQGCLASCLVLDQFPRNIFRATPGAFASDAQACAIARHACDQGFDQKLPTLQRMFLYMPFMHSENQADQDRCIKLFEDNEFSDMALSEARNHCDVIKLFGRFPHRNAIVGRESTDEEKAYLAEHGGMGGY